MANLVKINLRKERKSQIFIFDLIFALIIIIVAIVIILSYYNNSYDNSNLYDFNNQILNGLTKTELNSLNSNEIRQYFIDGKIQNIHNTVIQQIIDFYVINNISEAQDLTAIFVKALISREMNLNITLYNDTSSLNLYTKLNTRVKWDKSIIATTSKRVIIHFINNTKDYKFYTLEVKLWV